MTPNSGQSGASPEVILQQRDNPGCLIQALWFIFVGSWLGLIAISVAWVLNVTIIGLPLGMSILNNLPKILALRQGERQIQAIQRNGRTIYAESDLPQRSFVLRAIYFLLIGWWWSAIWLVIAYALSATVLLMPFGLKMFELTPAMTTLRRY